MRVLVVKTSSMGDVVHTLPALTDARRTHTDIVFDWVVEEGFAQIPGWHPVVERVLPVALRRWRRHPLRARRSGEWGAFREQLRERTYDRVIDGQGLLKSAWLTRLVDASTHGPDRRSAREPLASFFYDARHPVPRGRHAVQRTRQLFAAALEYPEPFGWADYGLDPSRFAASSRGDPSVVFLHGTTWRTKHWPERYWRELAEQVVSAGYRVRLPWASEDERLRAQRLAAGLAGAEVLPRTDLLGLARELATARACVAVDTGPGHLAAALAVPTVSLFGPTNPGLTGAHGREQVHLASDFPCAPCLSHTCRYRPTEEDRRNHDLETEFPLCFTRLAPDTVWPRLRQLLDATADA